MPWLIQDKKTFVEFIQLFNQGKYFESHEILEILWQKSSGRKKQFYQGLIQAAVALHHDANQNKHGAIKEYLYSIEKLKNFHASYLGVNIKKFIRELSLYFTPSSLKKNLPKIHSS